MQLFTSDTQNQLAKKMKISTREIERFINGKLSNQKIKNPKQTHTKKKKVFRNENSKLNWITMRSNG